MEIQGKLKVSTARCDNSRINQISRIIWIQPVGFHELLFRLVEPSLCFQQVPAPRHHQVQVVRRNDLFGMIQGSLCFRIHAQGNQVARVAEERGPMIRVILKESLA